VVSGTTSAGGSNPSERVKILIMTRASALSFFLCSIIKDYCLFKFYRKFCRLGVSLSIVRDLVKIKNGFLIFEQSEDPFIIHINTK
jgi:hypothetical protein